MTDTPQTEVIIQQKKETPLTPLELRFCEEYLIDCNATQAYLRAGFDAKNENTASVMACQLLGKPKICRWLLRRRDDLFERIGVSQRRAIIENARLAYFDARRLFRSDGTPKEIHELDDDTAACIGGIEVLEVKRTGIDGEETKAYVRKYKIIDKNPAIDRLFKYHALYKDLGSKDNPFHVKLDWSKLSLEELARYRDNPELALLSAHESG